MTLHRNNKGQALVEMALSIMLLMLILVGIFEFGRAMYVKNSLTNAARAGARQAVVTQGVTEGTTNLSANAAYNGTTGNDPIFKAVRQSLVNGITVSEVQVTIDNVDKTGTPVKNDIVEVQVNWGNFQTFTTLVTINNQLRGTASMRYE
jgi:Flp pilus assembly protein TadG